MFLYLSTLFCLAAFHRAQREETCPSRIVHINSKFLLESTKVTSSLFSTSKTCLIPCRTYAYKTQRSFPVYFFFFGAGLVTAPVPLVVTMLLDATGDGFAVLRVCLPGLLLPSGDPPAAAGVWDVPSDTGVLMPVLGRLADRGPCGSGGVAPASSSASSPAGSSSCSAGGSVTTSLMLPLRGQ